MNELIKGMMMPTQLQVQVSQTTGTGSVSGEADTGKFGSILASLSSHKGTQSEQVTTEEVVITDALAELFELTTVEDVMAFLQENGVDEKRLPQVIDGHFVFQGEKVNEELLSVLERFMPNLEEQDRWTTGERLVIPIRELFASLEEVTEDLLMNVEQGDLLKHFTNEEILLLTSMMQITVMEGPKVDLTLKQEHQLHTLQEMLKTLGHTLNEETAQTQRNPLLPFQVPSESLKHSIESEQPTVESTTNSMRGNEAFVKLTNSAVSQSSFTIPASMGMENVKLEGEAQGNSRAEMLLKELQNVFKRANFGQTNGTNRISIKLYPEHLGQLRIELLQTNGVLTARILASNALGKEMLESQLHQLRQAFLQQNIQVERIDISQMLTETPYEEREHAFNQHFKQQQEQTNEQNHQEDDEEAMSFSEYMIELEG